MKNFKKIILPVIALFAITIIGENVDAASVSSYFSDVACTVQSVDDFDCQVTLAKDVDLTGSKATLITAYRVLPNTLPEGKTEADYDYKGLSTAGKTYGTYVNSTTQGEITDWNLKEGTKLLNYVYGSVFPPNVGFDAASFDFIVKIIDSDGNGEIVYYNANTGAITKVEKIVAETSTKVEDKTVALDNNKTIDSSTFTSIKNNGNKVTFENKESDKVTYAWIFDGSKMESGDFNIDLSLNIGTSTNKSTIDKLVSNKDTSLVLEFAHHGDLPDGTTVKVYVGDKYANGTKLTLYYFNETTKKLEEVAKDIEVVDGYITFGLDHCSEYVLEKQIVAPNNAQTSSINIGMYILLVIVSISGIAILLNKKGKEVA